MSTNLYTEVLNTGGYISNYESDLYIEVNDVNKAILAKYPIENKNKTTFRNEVTGKMCWDIPFAYMPYWAKKGMISRKD